ncbi:MAG: RNA polymerase sigma factor [Myxococcota bacterium]
MRIGSSTSESSEAQIQARRESDLDASLSAPGRRSDPTGRPAPRPTQAQLSDEELVERLRTGDREAFNEIYQRYFKRVYAFLDKRLRNRADTEETTQEVFINIFSSIDGYRGDAPLAAWIFGLTRRTLAARFRKKRHPTVPLFEEDEDVAFSSLTAASAPEATPLENYEMVERANLLDHVLEQEITAEQRRLFEMHHLENMPIAEIAAATSKSEDSVKSTLYRTRKLLLK